MPWHRHPVTTPNGATAARPDNVDRAPVITRGPVAIDPRYHDGVLFNLDGVVTDTAKVHAAAWSSLFDDFLGGRTAAEGGDTSPFTNDDYRLFVTASRAATASPTFWHHAASPCREAGQPIRVTTSRYTGLETTNSDCSGGCSPLVCRCSTPRLSWCGSCETLVSALLCTHQVGIALTC